MKIMNGLVKEQGRTWQMSFNDLLTVLLVFFILLVSISNIRADKVQHVSSSATTAFGSKDSEDRHTKTLRDIARLKGVEAYMVDGGVSIVLGESLLYKSGTADIVQENTLSLLCPTLRMNPGQIRVEGHTDAVPMTGGVFPSNWELSAQRAVNVVKYLVAECGMNPAVFAAAGYGDSKPVATNETPDGRTLNRRVNIILSLK
jgi:chemotaxis protein MotB